MSLVLTFRLYQEEKKNGNSEFGLLVVLQAENPQFFRARGFMLSENLIWQIQIKIYYERQNGETRFVELFGKVWSLTGDY